MKIMIFKYKILWILKKGLTGCNIGLLSCLNNGKCLSSGLCECSKGFYGANCSINAESE